MATLTYQESWWHMPSVNMVDIAEAAGVSLATVGRVIHNNGYVSEQARQRVEKAVTELGYVPNTLARALKRQKSGVIGSMVVYNQNNLYQRINESIIAAANRHGYELLTLEGRLYQHDEEQIIQRFIGMRVDALVITSNSNVLPSYFERLHVLNIPVVAVERTYDNGYADNLVVEDRKGSQDAVTRMVAKGHRRIGFIAAQLFERVEKERYEGYVTALEEAGIKLDRDLIRLVPDYRREYAYGAMKKLMSLSAPPTAVFITADTMAAGAMQYLYEQRLRVPDDISLAGYDNVLSAFLSPPIDSVDLAIKNIGESVLSLVDRRLKNPNASPESRIVETIYVDRGTIKNRTQ